MNTIRFRLNISAEDMLHYYRGKARHISVASEDGRRIEFPALHLREFIRHDGVHGYFELQFDSDNRFHSIRQLAG